MNVGNLMSILSSMPQSAKVVAGSPDSSFNATHGAVKCRVHGDFTKGLSAETDEQEVVCILTENVYNP
jgi:hypothetical protein